MKAIYFASIITFFWSEALVARVLQPGLDYQILQSKAQCLHILKVDPSQFNLVAVHANGTVQGRETVESMAKQHQAIAAINGGFFKARGMADGLPAGILKINHQWYGIAYQARAAIGWSQQGLVTVIDRIQTKTTLQINQSFLPVHAFNRPGSTYQAVLYNPAYGAYADTREDATDILIKGNEVIQIVKGGHTAIPNNGYVYSIGSKVKAIPMPKIQDRASVHIEVQSEGSKADFATWQSVENIIGGTPLLIYQGNAIQNFTSEHIKARFIHQPYARTAVGLLKNGHWLIVVVEPNAFAEISGMTLPELSTWMHRLGAQYALNLDGGSSSTLYLNKEQLSLNDSENQHFDQWQPTRAVSDALLIIPKR